MIRIPAKKLLYLLLGHFFLVIGMIGIPTPILPTTPFLLLSAYFYSLSSEKFHRWLLAHPKLGPPIITWRKEGAISRRAKTLATGIILLNLCFPLFIIETPTSAKIVAAAAGLGAILFILSRPSPSTSI